MEVALVDVAWAEDTYQIIDGIMAKKNEISD